MRFPSIRDVAHALRETNRNVDGACDVRLQVRENKAWQIHWGDASYDQDHRGFWGAACVPGLNAEGRPTRFRSEETARDLIDQCKELYAQSR